MRRLRTTEGKPLGRPGTVRGEMAPKPGLQECRAQGGHGALGCPRGRVPSLARPLWENARAASSWTVSSPPPCALRARTRSVGRGRAKAALLLLFCTLRQAAGRLLQPSPTSSHSLALESLRARTRGAGDGNEPGEDFFITFLNVLLIARSGADVVCLMMHRQAAAPNP